MAEWTHNICTDCWNEREPDRTAVQFAGGPREVCCFCGEETRSGIFVRHDPKELDCDHEEAS